MSSPLVEVVLTETDTVFKSQKSFPNKATMGTLFLAVNQWGNLQNSGTLWQNREQQDLGKKDTKKIKLQQYVMRMVGSKPLIAQL